MLDEGGVEEVHLEEDPGDEDEIPVHGVVEDEGVVLVPEPGRGRNSLAPKSLRL